MDAVLTDLDGVLVDSIVAIERAWSQWADRHGLARATVLTGLHGVRAIEHVRRLAPDHDAEQEVARLERSELAFVGDSRAVPGAADLIDALPAPWWAVVTSGSRVLATARLRATGLALPTVLVTADDVTEGKPDPEGYLAAAHALGVDPRRCLVIEDAPAGIRAAHAAGCTVIGVTTSHDAAAVATADAVVADPGDLTIRVHDHGIDVAVRPHAQRTD